MNNSRKALLFLVKFYGYEKFINDAFIKKGYKTTVIFENYYNFNFILKLFSKISRKLFLIFSNYYFIYKIDHIDTDISLIFVLRGHILSEKVILHMKKRFQNARFIMYQWDCPSDLSNEVIISQHFDKVLTFSINDSIKRKWIYRPLFYIDFDTNIAPNKLFDIIIISSVHSERLRYCKLIKELCKSKNLKCEVYLFMPLFAYIYRKYILHDDIVNNISLSDVHFKRISVFDTYKLYKKSRIIFDYVSDNNAGLTMRTIESLGNDLKLITNNRSIMQEDFYNDNNIYVFDNDNLSIPDSFFMTDYLPIPRLLKDKYRISFWLDDILR